jgi:hypothetical protein
VVECDANLGRRRCTTSSWFASRRIELDTADLNIGGAANAAGVATTKFRSPPHEFGHTLSLLDEYSAGNPDLRDADSVMNIGGQIRPRHLKLIVDELNKMMPGVTFVPPVAVP